jgi:flagellar biogenesis protein FliO
VNSADDLALLARAVGGLVVVLVLIALAARVARRSRARGTGEALRVVDRLGLSRDTYVAVVEAGGRSLLLGVSPQGVSMLTALDRAPYGWPARTPEAGPVEADDASAGAAGSDATPPAQRPAAVGAGAAAPAAPAAPEPPVLPPGVDLSAYPDLASALRAAGRTTGGDGRSAGGASGGDRRATAARGVGPAGSGGPGEPAPATRRERRARGRQAAPVPQQRTAGQTQASGSVLAPSTWRQGLDALRDMTARRG